MDNLENLKKGEGGYIFVSHSHKDIDKVRVIRNILEEYGYEPLCFYLRCLTDDDEVEGLIKREIDSRDIFLYVNSENAKESVWVTKERNYISGRHDKSIYVVDLDGTDNIAHVIQRLLNQTRVFLSYSHKDRAIEEKIKAKLIAKDLKVFDDNEILVGSDWEQSIKENIEFACKYGCFVTLVSENSLDNWAVRAELGLALKLAEKQDVVIPVFIKSEGADDSKLPPEYLALANKQSIRISEKPTDEELDNLVKFIRTKLVHKVF